jgi:DNA-binding response OmpR family regulator
MHSLTYLGAFVPWSVARVFSSSRRLLHAADLHQADATMARHRCHVVLVDSRSAPPSALAACQALRTRLSGVGIVLMGCEGGSEQVAAALDAGADDCLTASTSSLESLARVRAVERRAYAACAALARSPRFLANGVVEVDVTERRLTVDGDAVDVTPSQLRFVIKLLANPGGIVASTDLFPGVTEATRHYERARLRTLVHDLRKRLGRHHELLRCAPGHGYYLRPEPPVMRATSRGSSCSIRAACSFGAAAGMSVPVPPPSPALSSTSCALTDAGSICDRIAAS